MLDGGQISDVGIDVTTADRLNAALGDRYRIERELGRGGMATVYLAHDLRHQRKVAIKVLHPELSAVLGPERFLKEIELTASLQHPHILPLFDSGSSEGLLYFVMPYVEGETLRARLVHEQQLAIKDALRIAIDVAAALEYAHKQGVVHRDIKPENILLHEGRPLVADFGIALAVQHAGGSRMTHTGMSLGTPHYMAPEQAMGERAVDQRADVYSLGAVTYEMLTGEPPFTGPTMQAILAKAMTDQPRPPSELRRAVTPSVDDAILTALEKLPADRWGSAAEFAAALNQLDGLPSRATRALPRAVRSRRARAALLALGAGVLVLAALDGRAWTGRQHAEAPATPVVRFTIPDALGLSFAGNQMAISPDGQTIVFVQADTAGDRNRLALRRLDRLETIPIPGTEGANSPFFSPDGEWIGFRQGNRLRKTRIDGGGLGTIVQTESIASTSPEAAWGPGDQVAFVGSRGRLLRISADGGVASPILPQDSAGYRQPVWLPDGEHLLVARSEQSTGAQIAASVFQIVVVSAREQRVVATLTEGTTPQHVDAGYLTWLSPEGALLAAPFDLREFRLTAAPVTIAEGFSYRARTVAVAVSPSGTIAWGGSGWSHRELVVVSPGVAPRVLPTGQRAFRGPRFSPDGSRIAVDVEPGGDLIGDVWIFDTGPQTFTRLTFEQSSVFPEWTPDGKSVLYSSQTPDGRGSFRIPADRSAPPVMLARSRANIFEAVLTPDEQHLLYRENSDSTGRDLLVRAADGTVTRWAAGPFQERSPALTRDGRLAAYVSDESGTSEVYVRPLFGGGALQVSSRGGAEPRWGPGDREVFYRQSDTLFAVAITRNPALRAVARRVALIGSFIPEPYHANYDVAPDGRTFVFVRQTDGASLDQLTVLLNWFSDPARSRR